MSIVVKKYIICDGEDCDSDGHTKATVDCMGYDIQALRKSLKQEGWQSIKYKGWALRKDYCPECFEKMNKKI